MNKAYKLEWYVTQPDGTRPRQEQDFDTRFEAISFMETLFAENLWLSSVEFRRRIGG